MAGLTTDLVLQISIHSAARAETICGKISGGGS